MKSAILFFFIFLKEKLALCSFGCLRCNNLNQCLICDTIQNYYLYRQSCFLSTLNSCIILSQDGSCLICKNEYYFDNILKNCLPIPPEKLLANCQNYNDKMICVSCRNYYYIQNGVCEEISKTVDNCEIYQSDGVCKKCLPGFDFSFDLTSCVALKLSSNCQKKSFLKCVNCESGFLYDENFYFLKYKNMNFIPNNDYQMSNTSFWNKMNVCSKIFVQNCKSFITATNCSLCEGGYFLSDGLCFPQPLPSIYGCVVYSDDLICSVCQKNMYLQSPNQCAFISLIENCLIYNTSSPISSCVECSQKFYLNQSKSCTPRIKSQNIQNCISYDQNADICKTCSSWTFLDKSSLLCLPKIIFCEIYSEMIEANKIPVCLLCAQGYFIQNGVCVKGSITNCRTFKANSNDCTVCSNKYYLQNNICYIQPNIQNCKIYSQNRNYCSNCLNGFISFPLSTVCVLRTLIPWCANYSTDGLSCVSCQNGTFLNNNICKIIPSLFRNCSNYSINGCLACGDSLMLFNGVCVVFPDYITNSCAMMNPGNAFIWPTPLSTLPFCLVCKPNSFLIIPQQIEAVCVQISQLNLVSNFQTVKNCYRYGYNLNGFLVCMECIQGLYLKRYIDPATFSVLQCDLCAIGLFVVLADDLFGSVNICMSVTATNFSIFSNCALIAKVSSVNFLNGGDSALDYSCVSSALNYNLVYFLPINSTFSADALTPGAVVLNEIGHGYTLYEKSIQGMAFNYRGIISVQVAAQSSIQYTNNCDLYWLPGLKGTRGVNPVLPNAWIKIASGQRYCLRCLFGISQLVIQNTTINSYPSCVNFIIGTCNAAIVLGGLPSYLNAIFSCHQCLNQSYLQKFPTIYLEYGLYGPIGVSADFNMWFQFSIPTTNGPSGFSCQNKVPVLTLGTQTMAGIGVNGPDLLTGCGSFGILTPVDSVNVAAGIINVCIACQHGYFPTYSGYFASNFVPNWAVSLCTLISNCDLTIQNGGFNSCYKCLLTVGPTSSIFTAFSDWSLTSCLMSITPNCFILISGASPLIQNNCSVCNSGYYLNKDGFCDILIVSNSLSNATFVQSYYFSSIFSWKAMVGLTSLFADKLQIRIYYMLQTMSIQYGVRFCSPNYVLSSPFISSMGVCVQSFYLKSGYQMPLISASSFVANCVQFYAANNIFSCYQCSSGFIPTIDGMNCVEMLPGCQFAISLVLKYLCNTCQKNFLNVAGKCQVSYISQCDLYQNNVTSTSLSKLLCSKCAAGYSLDLTNSLCNKGTVDNCFQYTQGSLTNCAVCFPSYALVYLKNTTSYCFPIDVNTNCQTADITNGIFSCSSCLQKHLNIFGVSLFSQTIANPNTPETICLAFNWINNCEEYDQNNQPFNQNNFTCTKCFMFYFLDQTSGKCVKRVNISPDCQTYDPFLDTCLYCYNNAFLSSKTKKCIAFPTGIIQCSDYINPKLCSRCVAPFYLSNNQCLQSFFVVPNCVYYQSDSACRQCESGYFTVGNLSCQKVRALNCLEVIDIFTCSKCDNMFILWSNNITTDCVPANIPNCVINSVLNPLFCIRCEKDFYPEQNGGCWFQLKPILNCDFYQNETICSVCAKGFALSVDQTQCVDGLQNLIDINCKETIISNISVCSECDFQFKLVNGICQSYLSDLSNRGCLIFDPNDFKNCWMCKSGYYQNSKGYCHFLGEAFNWTTNFTIVTKFQKRIIFELIFIVLAIF